MFSSSFSREAEYLLARSECMDLGGSGSRECGHRWACHRHRSRPPEQQKEEGDMRGWAWGRGGGVGGH